MKAIVKRVRIWDGDGKDGFGDSVGPFIARVHLADGASPGYELVVVSPDAGRSPIGDCHVVVHASSIIVEAAWKEFVAKTEFDGKGHATDVAERFASYLNDGVITENPQLPAPGPYS